MPEISSELTFESTPHFIVMFKDEELYAGNGHVWTALMKILAGAIKTAEDDIEHSRLTVDVAPT